jgi:hypothetical protein
MKSMLRIWSSRLALKVSSLTRSRISACACGEMLALQRVDLHHQNVLRFALLDRGAIGGLLE